MPERVKYQEEEKEKKKKRAPTFAYSKSQVVHFSLVAHLSPPLSMPYILPGSLHNVSVSCLQR